MEPLRITEQQVIIPEQVQVNAKLCFDQILESIANIKSGIGCEYATEGAIEQAFKIQVWTTTACYVLTRRAQFEALCAANGIDTELLADGTTKMTLRESLIS